MTDHREVTLAVLAGGRGERMGGPKSGLAIRGEPILKYIVERFRWDGPTLLVTSPGNERPAGTEMFDREVTDPVAGEGPLRGVLTALEAASTPWLAAVTVDMPAVATEILDALFGQLANETQAIGAMVGRTIDGRARVEPFPCVFRRAAATETIRRRLADGRRSVHGLADEAAALLAPDRWADEAWINLNRPEDLEQFLKRIRS